MESNVIFLLKKYLYDKGIINFERESNAVFDRQRGKVFTFQDHLRGLIYSLLTNQRQWSTVEPKLPQIDKLFFYYDVDQIKAHSGKYFEDGIRSLKCGNRSIKMQMEGLHYNIAVLESISKRYGSLDAYVTSRRPDDVVADISGGRYKLKGVGVALAWEYLRNVGIDGAKPDTHMKRFMGSERLAVSKHTEATDKEVIDEVNRLSSITGMTPFEIDYIIWCYCANGKGEVCTVEPKCSKCVIRQYCKRGNKAEYSNNGNNQQWKSNTYRYEKKQQNYNPDDSIVNRRRNARLLKENMCVPNGKIFVTNTIKLIDNEFDLGGPVTRCGVKQLVVFLIIAEIFMLPGSVIISPFVPVLGIVMLIFSILMIRYIRKLKLALTIQENTKKNYDKKFN